MIFLEQLRLQGYEREIPLETATDLFCQILDVWDRLTLKAYFGTTPHRSVRAIFRRAQYQSGAVSNKRIELSQDVTASKGYLEKMGLVKLVLKGKVWFLMIQEGVLVPQLFKNEAVLSMQNISLTPREANTNTFLQGKECEKTVLQVVSLNMEEATENSSNKQKNNNSQDERYKFHNAVICELNPLEKSILRATPLKHGEPDRSKVAWNP